MRLDLVDIGFDPGPRAGAAVGIGARDSAASSGSRCSLKSRDRTSAIDLAQEGGIAGRGQREHAGAAEFLIVGRLHRRDQAAAEIGAVHRHRRPQRGLRQIGRHVAARSCRRWRDRPRRPWRSARARRGRPAVSARNQAPRCGSARSATGSPGLGARPTASSRGRIRLRAIASNAARSAGAITVSCRSRMMSSAASSASHEPMGASARRPSNRSSRFGVARVHAGFEIAQQRDLLGRGQFRRRRDQRAPAGIVHGEAVIAGAVGVRHQRAGTRKRHGEAGLRGGEQRAGFLRCAGDAHAQAESATGAPGQD